MKGWSVAEIMSQLRLAALKQLRESRRGSAYRPSLMLLGRPFCQVVGAFQGREDKFSDSVVLQPLAIRIIANKITPNKMARKDTFISVNDTVAFHHFCELPAGHNIGNAAFRQDTHNLDFGDEFAVATDHHH